MSHNNHRDINSNSQHSIIASSELPTCTSCNLDPLPQSTQYLPFVIVQLVLILFSIKLSIIVVLIGYCFSKTVWICPLCKRQVIIDINKIQQSTSSFIIIRLNDFMMLVSKFKFRAVAVVLMILLAYFYIIQPKYQYQPRAKIDKTWRSIVTNCGYDAYIDNSFKFNYLYGLYQQTDNWKLQGVYLGEIQPQAKGQHKNKQQIVLSSQQKSFNSPNVYVFLRVKMIPTQFKDANSEDIQVYARKPQFQLQKGQILSFNGQWSGHRNHLLVFTAQNIQKTGKKVNDIQKQIQVLTHGMLRQHSQ